MRSVMAGALVLLGVLGLINSAGATFANKVDVITLYGADVFPLAVNHRMVVVGEILTGSASPVQAFVWDRDNGILRLPSPFALSSAAAINNTGLIAGGVSDDDGLEHAVVWNRGAFSMLPDLVANKQSRAADVNDAGEICGCS